MLNDATNIFFLERMVLLVGACRACEVLKLRVYL